MTHVMEIASFGVVEGSAPAAVAEAARALEPWLAAQPGFVSRILVGPDADGRFHDLVRWTSEAAALAAAAAAGSAGAASGFFALIDSATVQMRHVPIVLDQSKD